MKKFLSSLVILVMMTSISFAQGKQPTFEKEGDLVKATYFHENGMIKEVGFFKNDKLQDKWVSYTKEGKVKCVAHYDNGKKEGKWYIVGEDSVKEVTYKSNKIVKVQEVEESAISLI